MHFGYYRQPMNNLPECNRFAAKEWLHKCILACRADLDPSFRLSDVIRWVENYFIKEGGKIERAPVFVNFMKDLRIITRDENSRLSSKFTFNETRILELFDAVSQELFNVGSKENMQPCAISAAPNCLSDTSRNSICEIVQLPSQQDEVWLEEIITRLASLLSSDREDVLSALCSSESSDPLDCSVRENISLQVTDLASFVRSNCICALNSHGTLCPDNVVNVVTLACLDTLAKWPGGHLHQSELCEGFCAPHLILSCAIAHARSSFCGDVVAVETVNRLFQMIFQNWPSYNLYHKRNSPPCSRHSLCSTDDREQRTRMSVEPVFQVPETTPQSLPLPDIPLTHCSILSCKRNARSRILSVQISKPDVSSCSSYEYQPLAAPLAFYPKFPSTIPYNAILRPTVPCIGHIKSTDQPLPEQRQYWLRSSNPPMDSLANDIAHINLQRSTERRSSSAHGRTDSSEKGSKEFTLAIQLTLLLLPPLFYRRLRVLLHSLRQVLRNHAILGPALIGISNCATGGIVNTHESTLSFLSELSASVLFPLQTKPRYQDWRILLTRLLLNDDSGSLLDTPVNFVQYVQGTVAVCTNKSIHASPNPASGTTTSGEAAKPFSKLIRPSSLNALGSLSSSTLPICISSIASACGKQRAYHTPSSVCDDAQATFCANVNGLASTPMNSRIVPPPVQYQPSRSRSTDCFRSSQLSLPTCIHNGDEVFEPAQPIWLSSVASFSEHRGINSTTSGGTDLKTEFDHQCLASLSNTAHLIKLLNQIINDRQMDPRRKMKCILDFRRTHADVYWLRFGDQRTESAYFARLQRRIDGQSQPTVLERITNAFRRRRHSPQRTISKRSQSPPESTNV